MVAKHKACKDCKTLIRGGNKCPNCGGESISDNAKGTIIVLNPEESEIAKNLKLNKKGDYTVKA